jgi:hypothetical protein
MKRRYLRAVMIFLLSLLSLAAQALPFTFTMA